MNEQYCTFFVGDLYLGLPVLSVQEILRYQHMTEVPLASHMISGLINLRGDIVIAVDLRGRLGLPPRSENDELPTNTIVRTESGPISFLVDRIDDVVEVTDLRKEELPPTFGAEAGKLVRSVYRVGDRLLLVLDPEETSEIPESSSQEPTRYGSGRMAA